MSIFNITTIIINKIDIHSQKINKIIKEREIDL